MLTITIQVNAPLGSAQAVKEHLAMYMERFGDTRVVSIKEEFPQQMGMNGDWQANVPTAPNGGRKNVRR
jgi:hypothetical protein